MKYLLTHGTDGTEGAILGWANDLSHAMTEAARLLGGRTSFDSIPPVVRGTGRYRAFVWNFVRNGRTEFLKASPVQSIENVDGWQSWDLELCRDYSIFA